MEENQDSVLEEKESREFKKPKEGGVKGQGFNDLRKDGSEELDATVDAIFRFPGIKWTVSACRK